MRIAIIGSKGVPAKYGGVQKVVENVAEGLAALDNDVTVYGRRYFSENKARRYRYKNFNVRNIRGINSKRLDTLSHAFLSAVHAAFGKYDLVVFHSYIPAFFAFIPRICGKRTVFHSHGIQTDIKKIKKLDRLIILFFRGITRPFLTGITTVSASQLEQTKKIYNRKDVALIENGIEFREKPAVEREPYIVCVGRIVESKGYEYLIRAFNRIETPYRLVFVGEHVHAPNYYAQLLELSKDNPRIAFPGPKQGRELLEAYSKAALVVIPSEQESFSIVLYEALYYNGVVLCSDNDQFKLAVSGVVQFFENRNDASLEKELRRLLEDENARKALEAGSKTIDFDRLDWKHISRQYHDFYQTIRK